MDVFATMEGDRLRWVACNQETVRAGSYRGVQDAAVSHADAATTGRGIVLPASFTGGPRYMQGLYQANS